MSHNPINRRHFLQSGLKGLTALQLSSLLGCLKPQKTPGFHIFWHHWEGAPLRAFFDLWIDPYNHHPKIEPLVPQRKVSFYNQSLSVPELWLKGNRPSPLLKKFLSIRGLSTKSPHLKQCRMEWFSQDLLSQLRGVDSPISFSWSSSQENLAKTYRQILGPQGEIKDLGGQPLSFLKGWHKLLNDVQRAKHPSIHLVVDNRYKSNGYFESISTFSEKDIEEQQDYYRQFIQGLEGFVTDLQKYDLYDKSIILLTSDRSRVPTQRQPVLETETLWQGLNISLLSGAIKGPVILGHLAKEHPRYSENYPGTWGHGLSHWGPAHVHQLLADLCWSTGYTESKSWVSENPWIDLKPYHSLYIKEGPGQIIDS